ncbi:MAG: hypothetical protein ACKO2C_11050 [Actinomycetes bacterium]
MKQEYIIEDWLWEDDSPEATKYQMTYAEVMGRRRTIEVMLEAALVVVAVLVLAFVGWLVFRPKAPAKPDACQKGNLAKCANPSQRNTSETDLPGGFDPATGDTKGGSSKGGSSKGKDAQRLDRCLKGDVSACG